MLTIERSLMSNLMDDLAKGIYKYLYESDLFLSTSLYEGHPISILEAMSIGRPIITTNVPGCKETVIDNFNGYLLKCEDQQHLQ